MDATWCSAMLGKYCYRWPNSFLLQAKHIEEAMWGLQGMVIGELSVACSTTVGKYLLPQLIAGFRRLYAEVQVAVQRHRPARRDGFTARRQH